MRRGTISQKAGPFTSRLFHAELIRGPADRSDVNGSLNDIPVLSREDAGHMGKYEGAKVNDDKVRAARQWLRSKDTHPTNASQVGKGN